MAWNLKNIESTLQARLQARSTLVALLGEPSRIKPDETGGALYPAVNFRVSEYPNLNNQHRIELYLYIEVDQDTSGETNHNRCLDIAAEVEAELFYKPQVSNPVDLLDLSAYHYRCVRQEKFFDSGPILRDNTTGKLRQTQQYLLIIEDYS
jgi:hypothetical protein